MVGCRLTPKCKNGKDSKLFQDLYKYTGKNRKVTVSRYQLATHPQFLEGVDSSLIEFDSNDELTLESFIRIIGEENVDNKLLEFLREEYSEEMSMESAITKVKEFNSGVHKKSFIASIEFSGGMDNVKIVILKNTPKNREDAIKSIENMMAIKDVVYDLDNLGMDTSFIKSIISGNFKELGYSIEDILKGYKLLLSLSQGTSKEKFTESDFKAAALFALESLKDAQIVKRFIESVEKSSGYIYGNTNPVDVLSKAFQNHNYGKMSAFISKVKEFIYNIFSKLGLKESYEYQAEQIVNGLYTSLKKIPVGSYESYTINYTGAQMSLGKVLAKMRAASSRIHNVSTSLYESLFKLYNKKDLLSQEDLTSLEDDICYTIICDTVGEVSQMLLETLKKAKALDNSLENLPYKADLINSCREMFSALVAISKEYPTILSELEKSSHPDASVLKARMSVAMKGITSIISDSSDIVGDLQTQERAITISFFEEVLGKENITVSAHFYLGAHSKYKLKLKRRPMVTLTAEQIVDRYVSGESMSRWIKALSNSKDIAIAELEQFMRSIKFKEEKVKDGYFTRLTSIVARLKQYKLSTKDQTWAMEVDSNGKITGNFVTEEWWGEFKRQKTELMDKLRNEFNQKVESESITFESEEERYENWKSFYENNPEYIAFMDEAFLDRDKRRDKRRVLNLAKYTNPAYYNLSEDQLSILKDLIELKIDIDRYCLTDADGTMHARHHWLPQFRKGSSAVSEGSFILGNDVDSFVETAEYEDYGSPAFVGPNSELLDIFRFERDAAEKIMLYGIQKTESTLSNLETNLIHSLAKYALMAIRYKTVKSTASFLHIAKQVLSKRVSVSSDVEQVDSTDNLVVGKEESDKAMDSLIEKYSGHTKHSKWFKAFSGLMTSSSVALLGFNAIAAIRNKIAGNWQTIRTAISGKAPFNLWDLTKSKFYQIADTLIPLLPFNTLFPTAQWYSRTLALLDYVGSLKMSDSRLASFNTNKVSVGGVFSFLVNAAMLMMSVGDSSITANLYRSSLISHKGFDLKTGKRYSIFDKLKFANGKYTYQGLLVKDSKNIAIARALYDLKTLVENIKFENEHLEEEDKTDYYSLPAFQRGLEFLESKGLSLQILSDGFIISEDEVLKAIDDKLNPLIIRENDIFNIAYKGAKTLIHDQGNYDAQDKVKVMSEEYIYSTTHFQGWLYGSIQATLLNNVNVGIPSEVYVKKSNEHLRKEYNEFLNDNGYTSNDVSFWKYKKQYAELYTKYPFMDYNTDVSYSSGYFSTALNAVLSFFVINSSIRKIYNEKINGGVTNINGELAVTPEEVLIEANEEFTEDEKAKYIEQLEKFSSAKYAAYMILNLVYPYIKDTPRFRRFLMRCGWSPDELSSLTLLGIGSILMTVFGYIANLFYKGNLKAYGESKPKGYQEKQSTKKGKIKLIPEGGIFKKLVSSIKGPGSEHSNSKIEEFENNPRAKYGQMYEQYHTEDGTPTGEYVSVPTDDPLYNDIIEGLTYKFTEYDKTDPNYIMCGFVYYMMNQVNRELAVKINPYRTVTEAKNLFDMKASSIKFGLDMYNTIKVLSLYHIDKDKYEYSLSQWEKKMKDSYLFNKLGLETDRYGCGSITPYFEDPNGNKIKGYYYNDDGERIINYDHNGLQFLDFYTKDAKVKNFEKQKSR